MLPKALQQQPETDEELHAAIERFSNDMGRAIVRFLHGPFPDTQEALDAALRELGYDPDEVAGWGKEIADELMASKASAEGG